MRHVVWSLPFVTRGLAILAVLAGLGAGFLESTFGVGFVCVDTCPGRAQYFANLGSSAVRLLTPCLALEVAAFTAFVAYCLATQQRRRAVYVLLILIGGALVGAALLTVLARHAQATLPIWGGEEGDLLREGPLVSWADQWGFALTLVPLAWTGVLAYVQWRR